MIPVKPLNILEVGKKVRVRLPNGKTKVLIAGNNSTSTNAIAIGNRVYGSLESESVLKEGKKFQSKPAYIEEEGNQTVVSVWQEFYDAPSPINFATPRYLKADESRSQSKFKVDSQGWDTLEEAINSRGVSSQSGTYLVTNASLSKGVFKDLNIGRTPGASDHLNSSTLANLNSLIDNFNEGYSRAAENIYHGTRLRISGGDFNYQLQYGTNFQTTNIVDLSGNYLQATGASIGNNIYQPESIIPSWSMTGTVPYPSETLNGDILRSVVISGSMAFTITSPFAKWQASNKSVRWWLQFHDDNAIATPIELFSCNYLERIRVFLTALEDKAIFTAKIGHATGYSEPDPPVISVNPVFVMPTEFARIVVIEISKSGVKTEATYNYPNTPPIDPDNWQPWAYSYTDYFATQDHEYSDDCAFQRSANLRRINAAQKEFAHLTYDLEQNLDYEFDSAIANYFPPNDINSGYFANGQEDNFIVPALPYPVDLQSYIDSG